MEKSKWEHVAVKGLEELGCDERQVGVGGDKKTKKEIRGGET